MNEKQLLHNTETLKHINEVRKNIWAIIVELDSRAQIHDKSKFENPENDIFAENTPELAKTEYGSKEYNELLEKVKPAIEHHYSRNRHHPEFHKNGINDMDLVDLIELLCDWIAATKRNKKGNIRQSLEINKNRYNISGQLISILTNTVEKYF